MNYIFFTHFFKEENQATNSICLNNEKVLWLRESSSDAANEEIYSISFSTFPGHLGRISIKSEADLLNHFDEALQKKTV